MSWTNGCLWPHGSERVRARGSHLTLLSFTLQDAHRLMGGRAHPQKKPASVSSFCLGTREESVCWDCGLSILMGLSFQPQGSILHFTSPQSPFGGWTWKSGEVKTSWLTGCWLLAKEQWTNHNFLKKVFVDLHGQKSEDRGYRVG